MLPLVYCRSTALHSETALREAERIAEGHVFAGAGLQTGAAFGVLLDIMAYFPALRVPIALILHDLASSVYVNYASSILPVIQPLVLACTGAHEGMDERLMRSVQNDKEYVGPLDAAKATARDWLDAFASAHYAFFQGMCPPAHTATIPSHN